MNTKLLLSSDKKFSTQHYSYNNSQGFNMPLQTHLTRDTGYTDKVVFPHQLWIKLYSLNSVLMIVAMWCELYELFVVCIQYLGQFECFIIFSFLKI